MRKLLTHLTDKPQQLTLTQGILCSCWLLSNFLVVARAPLNPFGPSSPTLGEETDTTRNMDHAALRQEQQRIIEGSFMSFTRGKSHVDIIQSKIVAWRRYLRRYDDRRTWV